MHGVTKRFGATVALDGVDLSVGAGEVHALIGENGAGKSTLMKVLSGAIRPDGGTLAIDGVPMRHASPIDARRAGIAMIYQELNLAPDLSVEANAVLGAEPTRRGMLRRGEIRQRVREALAELDHAEIDPAARVADLTIGERQIVELTRALIDDARVVVLDEPTSSLSAADTERLFAVVDRLRDRGKAVIYISHFLDEVTHLGDRYTVLRDGRHVATGAIADTTIDAIIEQMVGRRIDALFPPADRPAGEPLLDVAGLSGAIRPRDASLVLHRGEVLGIAGLVGAGRSELLRAIYGLDAVRAGTIAVDGAAPDRGAPPPVRIAQGVGMLSEDRKGEGLATELSIEDNLTLSRLDRHARRGWLSRKTQRGAAREWSERLGVKCRDVTQPIGDLSGGNQQKVALGRLLHQGADVLLLDEPTRGVDVGSKAEIYARIDRLARDGAGVLLVSSYLPELLGLADRIAVAHRGRLGAARPRDAWTEATVMADATGSTA